MGRLSPVDEAPGAPVPKRLTTKGQEPGPPGPPRACPCAARQPQRSSRCFDNEVHNRWPRAPRSDTSWMAVPDPAEGSTVSVNGA